MEPHAIAIWILILVAVLWIVAVKKLNTHGTPRKLSKKDHEELMFLKRMNEHYKKGR